MDIKDKSIGSSEKEFPDDFEENKEETSKADDMDIKDFIMKKKGQMEEKEKKKAPKEEPVKAAEPLHDKIPEAEEEPPQTVPDEKLSSFAKVVTIYLKENEITETKKKLQDMVVSDYDVAMQAGIRITKENVNEVLSVLKYFSDNGYLVVISGERVEPLFHEPTK